MRALYDTRRFKDHRGYKKCLAHQSKAAPSQTLLAMGFKRKADGRDRSARCMMEMTCPGLTAASDARIAAYLSRTSAATGGAPSRRKIALILFAIWDWCELSPKEKKAVLRREEVLARWRNSRALDAVFSTKCTDTVYGAVGQDPPPCEECKYLYQVKTFTAALRRKVPLEENMKFVPKAHRCPELGDIYIKYHGLRRLMETVRIYSYESRCRKVLTFLQESPWLEFAKGAAEGQYQSETLLGMVQAMVIKNRRLHAGKGLQNIRYTSGFSDFCNILSALSTVAYRTFQQQFGGPTLETLT